MSGSRAPAVISQWRRFIAVGCVHSVYACKEAQDAVMAMVERWKPHTRIDLGDVHDFTAFRSGAKGTKDEAAPVELDYEAGVAWLRRFRPTHRCIGNHDHRVYRLMQHPSAIVAHAASKVVEALQREDHKNKTLVKPYDMRDGWWEFGDTRFGHGWMYNEMALRDHAETFGQCVIAHLHVPSEASGRRIDSPSAWCVGTLCRPDLMEYASARRATLRWGHGFVWGEYSDKQTIVRLERNECQHGRKETWRLPL